MSPARQGCFSSFRRLLGTLSHLLRFCHLQSQNPYCYHGMQSEDREARCTVMAPNTWCLKAAHRKGTRRDRSFKPHPPHAKFVDKAPRDGLFFCLHTLPSLPNVPRMSITLIKQKRSNKCCFLNTANCLPTNGKDIGARPTHGAWLLCHQPASGTGLTLPELH